MAKFETYEGNVSDLNKLTLSISSRTVYGFLSMAFAYMV